MRDCQKNSRLRAISQRRPVLTNTDPEVGNTDGTPPVPPAGQAAKSWIPRKVTFVINDKQCCVSADQAVRCEPRLSFPLPAAN